MYMVDTNNINLNLLRFFIVSAESKSLAEAGEKIGYSYSTVSTSISTLENQLGVKLFTRKPLKLTEVGNDIYETVKSGFKDIDFAMVIADSKMILSKEISLLVVLVIFQNFSYQNEYLKQ